MLIHGTIDTSTACLADDVCLHGLCQRVVCVCVKCNNCLESDVPSQMGLTVCLLLAFCRDL